jgi:Mn2+/Fe2+ NRAMP family transporter
VLNGILLPFVLVFMLLLVNKTELMGRYKNGRLYNVVAWTLTIVIVVLTSVMLIKQ